MSVRIHPMVCGWLEVDASNILTDQPGRWKLPVPSFLIEHPKGRAVFDTGLHRDLQRNSDRLGRIGRTFEVHYRAGEDLGARLSAYGVDPGRIEFLINSHFHFDHVGGNAAIPNAPTKQYASSTRLPRETSSTRPRRPR